MRDFSAHSEELRPHDYLSELKPGMYSWRQGPDESVEEYVERCRHVWNKLNLTMTAEKEDAKHFFIKGLISDPYLEEVLNAEATLQGCFVAALRYSKRARVPTRRVPRNLFVREAKEDEVAALREDLAAERRVSADT